MSRRLDEHRVDVGLGDPGEQHPRHDAREDVRVSLAAEGCQLVLQTDVLGEGNAVAEAGIQDPA